MLVCAKHFEQELFNLRIYYQFGVDKTVNRVVGDCVMLMSKQISNVNH